VPLSTALALVTKMSEIHKHSSPSAIQVENQENTISIEEKLDIVSQLKRG
jgi:hypothetical protein